PRWENDPGRFGAAPDLLTRILRYVRGTLDHGLQLHVSSASQLAAFTDADWAGCLVTRRSTFGYCVFFGDNLLSWSAKRHVTLSRSSVEAKYRGVANVAADTAWIRNLLLELHASLTTATLVYCDNVSAVYLSTNLVQHQRTKYIEIDIHFVRDYVASRQVRVLHVSSRFYLTRRWCFLSSFFKPHYRPIQEKPISPYSLISSDTWWAFKKSNIYRNYGSSVRCVISDGKPKFETFEIDPPKKYKWLTKKRLKLQRKKEKKKRRGANKNDPRRLTVKGSKKKGKFANAGERIQYKLEKARIKEALLIERLKRYEVSRLQGPMVKPVEITGEERFYMKKMAQKGSNYVPVGRRGVFGGVILNMHMHWKKHETVKIIGDDTIVFYRGKEYVQPEVMSPIDTLSKKKALEKSKYEQSLETVRHFIAILEKEFELYHRHIALYDDPAQHSPNTISSGASEVSGVSKNVLAVDSTNDGLSATEADEDDHMSLSSSDMNRTDDSSTELDTCDEET
nr:uncharacterized CRM domain-containing protein At3g25440, chloroplastic [Tanacetum cinerariifolium]